VIFANEGIEMGDRNIELNLPHADEAVLCAAEYLSTLEKFPHDVVMRAAEVFGEVVASCSRLQREDDAQALALCIQAIAVKVRVADVDT
jgi:hypothetical protein